MSFYLGVDIGGSFTDVALVDSSGRVSTFKALSTPQDLIDGVRQALTEAAGVHGLDLKELLSEASGFAHGTTAATNAFLERKGARTGLLTTRGFGDTIFMQRIKGMAAGLARQELAHYSARGFPEPLVPRELVVEIDERVDSHGREVVALDEDAVRAAGRALAAEGAAAVAVCFLWSFLNPAHEQRAAEILREELPEADVVLSVDVAPVLGEYERTATTVVSAYLAPPVGEYLRRLHNMLQHEGLREPLAVLNSSGGVTALEHVGSQVASLLLSGPTAGVTASLQLAQGLDVPHVITTDMGGTSFDVGLIVDGQPLVQPVIEIGKYHLAQPMLGIETIGAGSGSVARVRDGYLMVGPESAGAEPGPACYGRGGSEPTVTDADLVLGVLDPQAFLAGRLRLDEERARKAIERHVAEPLGLDVVAAAAGIRRIADSQMGDLLRRVTVERGFDPADFVLFAYGGAGPTHCCGYAAELGVQQIVVPLTATAHSAYGAAVSDLVYTAEHSQPLRTPAGFRHASEHWRADEVEVVFADLEERLHGVLSGAGFAADRARFERSAEMRYRRQTQSLAVPAPAPVDAAAIDDLVDGFEAAYERRYGAGSGYRDAGVELVTWRVRATVPRPRPPLVPLGGERGDATLLAERPVYHLEADDFLQTAIYDGEGLSADVSFAGPAVVQYTGTTVLVAPGWRARTDRYLNLWLDRAG